jgi:hypothetical protein
MKYLEEAYIKYSKWKINTKLAEKQMERTIKKEESAKTSEIKNE